MRNQERERERERERSRLNLAKNSTKNFTKHKNSAEISNKKSKTNFTQNSAKKRIFITLPNEYEKICKENYFSARKLGTKELKNAICVPHSDDIFGIYDEKFKNIIGLDRLSPVPKKKISPIKNITKCDESVIFIGCSLVHFGHILLEGLQRLWFVIKNPKDTRKVVFIGYGNWGGFDTNLAAYFELLALLNIPKERVLIIKKPTKFTHITIPDLCLDAWGVEQDAFYTKEYAQIYEKMAQKANEIYAKEPKFERIFLSHSRFKYKENQCFLNEQIYDEIFEKLNFKVLFPEEISVSKMAYLINNAKQIATTMGTTAHFGLFAKPNTRIILLTRDYKIALKPQVLVNQAINLEYFIINTTQNYLPSFNLSLGLVNFEFTQDFKDFVAQNFDENLTAFFAKFDANFKQERLAFAYLRAFAEFFSKPNHVNECMKNVSVYDILNRFSEIFLHKSLDRTIFTQALMSENLSQNKAENFTKWHYFWHKKFLYNLIKKPLKYTHKKLIFNLFIKPIFWLKKRNLKA